MVSSTPSACGPGCRPDETERVDRTKPARRLTTSASASPTAAITVVLVLNAVECMASCSSPISRTTVAARPRAARAAARDRDHASRETHERRQHAGRALRSHRSAEGEHHIAGARPCRGRRGPLRRDAEIARRPVNPSEQANLLRLLPVPPKSYPGKDGAILLTLANGSQILLDTIQNGVVALAKAAPRLKLSTIH